MEREYIKDYMNGMNHTIITKKNSNTIIMILVIIRATIVFQNIVIVALIQKMLGGNENRMIMDEDNYKRELEGKLLSPFQDPDD